MMRSRSNWGSHAVGDLDVMPLATDPAHLVLFIPPFYSAQVAKYNAEVLKANKNIEFIRGAAFKRKCFFRTSTIHNPQHT